jgi:tRNA(Ile)-lysidine synthase
METSDFDFQNLYTIFENSLTNNLDINHYNEIIIAYSGGVDSSTLLYFANKLSKKLKFKIRAVHINHNLNIRSKEWEDHCVKICKKNKIPLEIGNLKIMVKPGESIEEQARKSRYEFIYSLMNEESIMLTAHHLDDQAETYIYNLLRGSGLKGLSSMPVIKTLDKGVHVRPFLNFTKNTLSDFVRFKDIEYIEDNSNENINFSRNFIRKEVFPKIKKNWTSYATTISRAASNASDSIKLNNDLAKIDIEKYLLDSRKKISVNVKKLDKYRFNNVIRYWIEYNGYRMPSSMQLNSIHKNVFRAGEDKSPFFSCAEYEIRRNNNYVEIMNPLKKHDSSKTYKWKFDKNLVIPDLSINLTWKSLEKKLGYKLNKDVEVKFRRKGQNIKLSLDTTLKDYMRENKIPVWKRDRALLIYVDKELKIIWD